MIKARTFEFARFVFSLPFSRRQRKLARSRTALTKDAFVDDIARSGGDAEAAAFLWDHLEEWGYQDNFTPYPDDNLERLFGIAEEERDIDLIQSAFDRLGLQRPTMDVAQRFGPMETPRRIAQFVRQVRSAGGVEESRFPRFPITILFDDGTTWEFQSVAEIGATAEYFDSDDPTEQASVTDAVGRRVRLFVEHLEVKRLALEERE